MQNTNVIPLEDRVCASDKSAAIRVHNALVEMDCLIANAINRFDYESAQTLLITALSYTNALQVLTHKKDTNRAYDKGDEAGYARAVRDCAVDLPAIQEFLQEHRVNRQ